MTLLLMIYFGITGVLAAMISLWHLCYFVRHGRWNDVSMSTSEEQDHQFRFRAAGGGVDLRGAAVRQPLLTAARLSACKRSR